MRTAINKTMNKLHQDYESLKHENQELRERLQEAIDALDAISSGEVDALVVKTSEGEQVFSLKSADYSYRVLIERMQEAAVSLTNDGIIVYANKSTERILNTSLEKIIGSRLRDFVHSGDRELFQALFQQRQDSQQVKTMEIRLVGKGGEIVPTYISQNQIFLDAAQIFCAVITDLREQKRQNYILEEEQLSRSIIRQSLDAIIVSNHEGIIIRASQAANELTGVNCLNRSFNEIFDLYFEANVFPESEENQAETPTLDSREELKRFTIADVISGTTYQSREASISRGGIFDSRHLLISAAPLTDDSGNGIGAIVNIADITEQKRVEQKLRQAQKMDSIGRLVGGVAHDYNNMLGVILGYADLALGQVKQNQSLYHDLREIYDAAIRSAKLTEQLLAFARKQPSTPKVIDLNMAISNVIRMLERLIGENITLSFNPADTLWNVNIDPSQIDQCLTNLSVNARDAIEDTGILTISTKNVVLDEDHCTEFVEYTPGDYVLLEVSDDGVGMNNRTLRHVFEPFFTTKSKDKGTGLGLSTVYGIVKQNNGFITIYSEIGLGTTIKIYLPRYYEEHEEVPVAKLSEETHGEGETILLVEDDLFVRKMTESMLKRLGYTVVPAGNALEAIEVSAQYGETIHLLMTDVIMPEMNGKELAKQLSIERPEMKILFMSGYTDDIINKHGMTDKTQKFIQKPFNLKQLDSIVKETIAD